MIHCDIANPKGLTRLHNIYLFIIIHKYHRKCVLYLEMFEVDVNMPRAPIKFNFVIWCKLTDNQYDLYID